MILLIIFKNYYIFIIILPFITFINNLTCTIIANRKYPNYTCKGKINKEFKKNIKNKVLGLLIYKICAITRNPFDSIFISAFLGLNVLAIYNNYYLILSSVTTFLSIITTSMAAAVGNSIAVESVNKNYNDMNKFNFIYMWISGWCAICMLCLYQPFMKLWLGNNFLLPFSSVILFCIYFYFLQIGVFRATYEDAVGLWWETKYRAVIESALNLVLNFILGKIWGLNGIIIATLISLSIVDLGYGSTIIFKYYFKNKKTMNYFLIHLKYLFTTIIIAIITFKITSFIHFNGFKELCIKTIICIIIPNILYTIAYIKNKYLSDFLNIINEILKNNKN